VTKHGNRKTWALLLCTVMLLIPRAKAEELQALRGFLVPVGSVPTPLPLVNPQGRTVSLADFRGKPLLVNFYTVHCPPCHREVPVLNAVQAARTDWQVLAVTPDAPSEAAAYVTSKGLKWPVAAGAQAYLRHTLGVMSFPSFALFDAQGRLLATTPGNQLGGEDGHATQEGIQAWVNRELGRDRGLTAR